MEDDPMCGETVDARYLALAVEAFAVLAQADRLRLLIALGADELSINHLADITELSPPAVQQHLAMLELVGMVRSHRYGERPFYSLNDVGVRRLILQFVPAEDEAGAEGYGGAPEPGRSRSVALRSTAQS